MIRKTVLTVVVAMLLITIVAVPAEGAARGVLVDNGCVGVSGIFDPRWKMHPHTYGCAISPLWVTYDGRYQNFERGQMVWSPGKGDYMVISGWWSSFAYGGTTSFKLDLEWGTSAPFAYERWHIRLDRDNQLGLAEGTCFVVAGSRCHPTSGSASFTDTVLWPGAIAPGHSYQLKVRGCHSHYDCPEGWTIPVWLWF
ncbi:hypothetical protein GCM10022243_00690 [Saccharothrix violaceirubra]|uniref:Uncharacterized protein n=1 Tax=Saccharothrix violaceirubra TaxID=413306 RepID=A0A7W7T2Q7_9PSEU|nr:hypothetical protein [Saccharothrix violaceirubra]MBB4965436.1 hypothetical protein [Saccharothrix violaceirubra]